MFSSSRICLEQLWPGLQGQRRNVRGTYISRPANEGGSQRGRRQTVAPAGHTMSAAFILSESTGWFYFEEDSYHFVEQSQSSAFLSDERGKKLETLPFEFRTCFPLPPLEKKEIISVSRTTTGLIVLQGGEVAAFGKAAQILQFKFTKMQVLHLHETQRRHYIHVTPRGRRKTKQPLLFSAVSLASLEEPFTLHEAHDGLQPSLQHRTTDISDMATDNSITPPVSISGFLCSTGWQIHKSLFLKKIKKKDPPPQQALLVM